MGPRISPGNVYNDISEDDPTEVYAALLDRLAALDLAYLHLMEGPDRSLTARLRKAWPGTFVLNPFTYPDATGPDAQTLVEDGSADMVAYGALRTGSPPFRSSGRKPANPRPAAAHPPHTAPPVRTRTENRWQPAPPSRR